MSDIIKYFRLEAAELLETMQRSSLDLEKEADRTRPLNELKRAAHSLKGSARLVEYFDIGDAAHEVEDYLVKLEAQRSEPTEDQISNLLAQVDQLEVLLEQVVADGQGKAVQVDDGNSTATDLPLSSKEIELESGPDQETIPNVSEGEQEGFSRVASGTLEEISLCAGKLIELSSRTKSWTARLHQLQRCIAKVSSISSEAFSLIAENDVEEEHGRFKERKIAREELSYLLSSSKLLQDIENGLELLSPLSSNLHNVSLSLRLVRVEKEAYRFEKIVRSTAMELGVQTRFVLNGEKTKIDRKVLQQFIEPLGHLVRNAVAHGIETPEQRQEANKPPEGTIALSFEKRGDFLEVTVEDDGRGIDIDAIRETALAIGDRNLSSEVASMSVEELRGLIFRPGFTTKKDVSQIAGRGVGLDVVWEEVQRLRGSIRIESEKGLYCRFIVTLPSNLDVLETMVLGAAGQQFLVPMSAVSTTMLITPDKIVNHTGQDAILIDATPVFLHSLSALLSLETSPAEISNSSFYEVVVLRAKGERFAVVADSLSGKRPVVVRGVGPTLKDNALLSGAAVLSDGLPAFLLDVSALRESAGQSQKNFQSRQSSSFATEAPSILVVDDSLTTRMLEKSLLEAAGYKATLANDGMQAELLLKETNFDLLIVDFEMPGMNGIELTERVRQNPKYEHLPIIMLTSIGSDENKRKGLAAGVQAYLVKGVFDQNEFLETVRRLIGQLEEAA